MCFFALFFSYEYILFVQDRFSKQAKTFQDNQNDLGKLK